jgi:hypothetical protein
VVDIKYPIHHFYHIYCGNNFTNQESTWTPIVEQHFSALKTSELINHLNTTYIGLVGLPHQREEVKQYLFQNEINYMIIGESDSGWEQITQDPLYNFSKTNNGYILYAHTKGGFNNTEQNIDWCKSMTHFNIIKWRDCVARLNQFDAVGCYWHDFSGQAPPHLGGPHIGQRWFAGTFWWSKLNRIRDIGHGPTHHTRWDAEVWIGQIPNISAYDLTGPETENDNAIITQ